MARAEGESAESIQAAAIQAAETAAKRAFNLRLSPNEAPEALSEILRNASRASWVHDAVEAWKAEHPDATDSNIDALQSEEGDIALWLIENLPLVGFEGQPSASEGAKADFAKSGEGEGEGETEGEPEETIHCPFLMSGWQVDPLTGSPAIGFGLLTAGPGATLSIDIEHGVADPVAAHLHNATGTYTFDLGSAESPIHVEFTTQEIEEISQNGVDHVDIHSGEQSEIEILGAPLCDDLLHCDTELTGDQVVPQPQNPSTESGWAGFAFDPATAALFMRLEHTVSNATAFHIHAADGDVSVNFPDPDSPLMHLFTPEELGTLWRSGGFNYIDLHSDPQQYPDGELRGSICDIEGNTILICPGTLSGDMAIPPSQCQELGSIVLYFDVDTFYTRLHIDHPLEDATAVHLHAVDGSISIDFGNPAMPFDHVLTAPQIIDLIEGRFDILDVHSETYPDGALGGIPDCNLVMSSQDSYAPGCELDYRLYLDEYSGDPLASLGVTLQLPSGWTFEGFDSGEGEGEGEIPGAPDYYPDTPASGVIEFIWVDPPGLPVELHLTLLPSAQSSGEHAIVARAEYRTYGNAYYTGGNIITLAELESEPEGEGEPACPDLEVLSGFDLDYAIEIIGEEEDVEGDWEWQEGFWPWEGEIEGVGEGEGQQMLLLGEGENEGENVPCDYHSGDTTQDWAITLTELLRVIQFFNSGGFHCDDSEGEPTEDGYVPGPDPEAQSCEPHDSDYHLSGPDWQIKLTELLRFIQFFNSPGYAPAHGTEDDYYPGRFRTDPLPSGPDYDPKVNALVGLRCSLNQDDVFVSPRGYEMYEVWVERLNPTTCDTKMYSVSRSGWAGGDTGDTYYVKLMGEQNVRTLNPRPEAPHDTVEDFEHFCPLVQSLQVKPLIYTDQDQPGDPAQLVVRINCDGQSYEPVGLSIGGFFNK